MGDNRVVNARMLQQTSDNIAKAVLGQVITSKAITNVNIFLNQDIVGALASGQTIGGWGGAFYYWDAPYVPDGAARTTVGQYILSHPDDREKFVACNAAASLDAVFLTDLSTTTSPFMNPDYESQMAVGRLKLLLDGLRTNGQAQAPQFIKDEIRQRATAMVLGRKPAGDPDHIGDYSFIGNGWSAPRVYHTEGGAVTAPTPEHNPDVVKQLNARRTVRQSHSSFRAVPAF